VFYKPASTLRAEGNCKAIHYCNPPCPRLRTSPYGSAKTREETPSRRVGFKVDQDRFAKRNKRRYFGSSLSGKCCLSRWQPPIFLRRDFFDTWRSSNSNPAVSCASWVTEALPRCSSLSTVWSALCPASWEDRSCEKQGKFIRRTLMRDPIRFPSDFDPGQNERSTGRGVADSRGSWKEHWEKMWRTWSSCNGARTLFFFFGSPPLSCIRWTVDTLKAVVSLSPSSRPSGVCDGTPLVRPLFSLSENEAFRQPVLFYTWSCCRHLCSGCRMKPLIDESSKWKGVLECYLPPRRGWWSIYGRLPFQVVQFGQYYSSVVLKHLSEGLNGLCV